MNEFGKLYLIGVWYLKYLIEMERLINWVFDGFGVFLGVKKILRFLWKNKNLFIYKWGNVFKN